MQEYLSEQELKDNIEQTYMKIKKENNNWKRGLITEDDRNQRCENDFFEGFYDFLRHNDIRIKMQKNWHHFLKDYADWKDSKPLCESMDNAWLMEGNSKEASCSTREKFFELMEALCLTPDYFEPLPAGVAFPSYRWPYMDFMQIYFDLSDETLFEDTSLEGRTLHLKDKSSGLEAVMTVMNEAVIEESFVSRVQYRFRSEEIKCFGVGSIEGYTASNQTKIAIIIDSKENKAIRLIIDATNEDFDKMCHFPMWADYWRFCDEKEILRKTIMKNLREKCM